MKRRVRLVWVRSWSLVRVVGSYPQTNVGGVESYFTVERKLNRGKTSKPPMWGQPVKPRSGIVQVGDAGKHLSL